jgi:uncharacterized membrane protein
MEAFSDGVLAIIITIMVLELKAPHGAAPGDLLPLVPAAASYLLSFVYLGIYWNNHHHLLHVGERVNGRVLWANLHLLFWLSLVPFTTAWMGENHFAAWPVALYGVVLLCAAIAYFILSRALIALHGADSTLATAIGRDRKGKVSVGAYVVGVACSLVVPWVALAIYGLVAMMWLVPDRRIERRQGEAGGQPTSQ